MGDETQILGYVKSRGKRFLTEGPPDRSPQDRSGATPIRCARTHLLPKDRVKLEHTLRLCCGLEGLLG
jgi:hypothetical protein